MVITAAWSVTIIPAPLTRRVAGSNPSLDPKRLLETSKLALLTPRLLTPEHWEVRGVDGTHVRLLFLVELVAVVV